MRHSGDCPAGIGPFDCCCGAAAQGAPTLREIFREDAARRRAVVESDAGVGGVRLCSIVIHPDPSYLDGLKTARGEIEREIARVERAQIEDEAARFKAHNL